MSNYKLKGKTYEELHGVDKAKEMKSKQSKKRKIICNTPEARERLREAGLCSITPVKDTSIEVKIQDYLKQLGIEFLTHQYMIIEHRYRCDIFIPSQNLVIECDGDYWHGHPGKYSNDELTRRQRDQRMRDKFRNKELVEKGFKVLRLWECEIKEMTISEFESKIKQF